MTNPRGEPVRAWYHADAGGKTATAEEGLAYRDAPTPHLQVVEAPSANPEAAWTESFEPAEFLAAVRQAAPGAQVAAVTTVTISRRGPSGRATELLVGRVRVPAVALRMALDPRRMRSTMLTAVSVQPGGRVTMSGRGAGHGVGLPQWSARYYAERGETAAQILERFFRGVKVETWWR
jgi:stage II sporulation protein D